MSKTINLGCLEWEAPECGLITARHTFYVMAGEDSKVVGSITVEERGQGIGSIRSLHMEPCAPQGATYMLLRAGFVWLRHKGVDVVRFTAPEAVGNRRCIRRLGFRKVYGDATFSMWEAPMKAIGEYLGCATA